MNVSDLLHIADCRFVSEEDAVTADGRPYQIFKLEYIGNVPNVCPICGGPLYRHGNRPLTVTDTPFRGLPVEMEISFPRKRCRNCQHIWQPELTSVHAQHQVTDRAFTDIANRGLSMTFKQVCHDYVLTENTAKNIFVNFIRENHEKLRFKMPAFLGIDEIKIRRLGEVTVVTDLEHHTLFDMFQGRTADRLLEYFSGLWDTGNVLWLCSDMYRSFGTTLHELMPNATWVIDHFHVVMKANEAMDDVRKKIQADMGRVQRVTTKKGLAFTLRKRMRDLTAEEAEKIRIMRTKPEYGPLSIAYDLKEAFFNIYDDNPQSKENAKRDFIRWEQSIPEDSIFDGFRTKVAQMVHNHSEEIFARWDCPIAISNGFTECINRLIRENNLKGRGYSFEILRARTLYRRTNLLNLRQNGLIYGPEITESGPNFYMEAGGIDQYDIDLFGEDDVEDLDYEPGMYDAETGEVFE